MHIMLLAILSNFFFSPMPLDWQMNQQDVVIRGTVLDSVSGLAITDATVYALSDTDAEQVTSDSNGHFIFLTLRPGSYRLCASKYGYALRCAPRESQPQELFPGFEYGATVVLSR